MTRKPALWIILALLGLAGSVLAFRLFPVAFPILSVDIQMDRQSALAEARALADQHEWDPEGYRQAATFAHLNPAFQTYMELEGGGLEELNSIVREGAFTLYAWRVRHFAEETVEEAEVRFTPEGRVYGFRLRISEDTPGPTLGTDEARVLAVDQATRDWGVEPSLYELLESSQEELPSGRMDHTFVFERSDISLAEAKVRLRLGVAGDRLVQVTHFVHVPDAFLRRYQETRNANESVSLAGTIVFVLLFLVIGGGVGTVHLLRGRWIQWRAPLVWGGVVAGLMALDQVNNLPLSWMGYNTALPEQVHVATLALVAVVTFLGGTIFLALIFMAGEGLMRLGFPEQIQQWKIWAPGVANTTPVLGRTLAPYAVVGIELGFVVVFYLFTSQVLGWWSPASALAAPDLLATRFPWITAVGTSLFAAFSEETLFRAIPIGAAAILGRRHGRFWLWIWAAVVLQALVFGASHANYPQQPAYARVVEIFPTYVAWGFACVFFGLVPAIIAHYLYDLVFFSLPLFAADTGGLWIDRSIVIAAGLLPVLVVLWTRRRSGGASTVPDWALNRSWRPPAEEGVEAPTAEPPPEEASPADEAARGRAGRPLPAAGVLGLGAAGLTGLAVWVSGIGTVDSPRLAVDRGQMEAEARSALEAQGISLGEEWTPLFSVASERPLAHWFVWEEGSEDDYRNLLGDFLNTPNWRVRFVSFEVPPEERAEAFTVGLYQTGRSPRVTHDLPEGRAGARLPEEEARILATEAVELQLGGDPERIREISADENVLPERTDWTFTFAATEGYPLAEGEGRFMVRIAGEEVVGVGRFVHIPEEWARTWQAEESKRALPSLVPIGLLIFLTIGAGVLAIVMWARGHLETRPLRLLSVPVAVLFLFTGINEWPNAVGVFSTTLSFGNQTAMVILGVGLGAMLLSAALSLLASLGHTWLREPRTRIFRPAVAGGALAMAFIGASQALSRLGPSQPPTWPDFSGAVTFVPWLAVGLGGLIQHLILTSVLLFLLGSLERIRSTGWTWAGIPLLLVLGFSLASYPPGTTWLFWTGGAIAVAAGIGIFWTICRRLGWAVLPGAAAAVVLLGLVETGLRNPFPGAVLGACLGAAAVVVATLRWTREL